MNGALIAVGIILIFIGIVINFSLNVTSTYINKTVQPSSILNSIGHSENNTFSFVGWGLIIVGFILAIAGIFTE